MDETYIIKTCMNSSPHIWESVKSVSGTQHQKSNTPRKFKSTKDGSSPSQARNKHAVRKLSIIKATLKKQ